MQSQLSTTMSPLASPFLSCFRPSSSTTADDLPYPPLTTTTLSTKPNLSTYLYYTDHGLVSLTWSRSILDRSLHVQLHHDRHPFDSPTLPSTVSSSQDSSLSSFSFYIHIKPIFLWKKHGWKKLSPNTHIFWSIDKARFGSGPEPLSGFYVAVVVENEMTLVVGDLMKEAHAKTRAIKPKNSPFLVLKKDHVVSNKIYNARAKFGGKMREIQIDCGYSDDTELSFCVDNKRVLDIQPLRWKFRGNERVEVDGFPIHISWDVYNWLFDSESNDGHAVFMFKFEQDEDEDEQVLRKDENDRSLIRLWAQQNLYEWGKAGKSFSSLSMSMSSSAGSFGGSSSVMEWTSTEENELAGPTGFSLLVYAWKR